VEDAVHGLRGLGADGEPVLHALFVEDEGGGLGAWVVVTEHFDKVAITRCALVSDDHTVVRLLLLAGAT